MAETKTAEQVESALQKTDISLYTDYPGLNAQKMNIIKNTICKGLDFLETCFFMQHCHGIGLNPFNKEAWAWKDKKGKIVSTVSEAGYRVNAERHPQYGGIKFGVIYDGDDFGVDFINDKIKHNREGLKTGKPIGAWAQAFRKELPTITVVVNFDEYNKSGESDYNAWSKNPSDMIAKVARTKALSIQFPVSGAVPEFEVTTKDGQHDYVDHTKGEETEEQLAQEELNNKIAEALELWELYEGDDKQRIGETIRHMINAKTITVDVLNDYIDAMTTKK